MKLVPYTRDTFTAAPVNTRIISAITSYVDFADHEQILLSAAKLDRANVYYIAYHIIDDTVRDLSSPISTFEDMFHPAFLILED